MVRQLVEQVVSQLAEQLNIVQEAALSPMRLMIQAVNSGIWIGEGANAFVEEVSSLVIPGVGRVGEHITHMSANTQSAREIIERGDEQASHLIQGRLADQFKFY
jgi:hypothetical protein